MKVLETNSNFEREPLVRPFGFKGGYMHESWQTAAYLQNDSGEHGIGLGTQSVLWSDAAVFTQYSESGGNALMYAMLEHGLQLVKNQTFDSPTSLLDEIWPKVLQYGKTITNNSRLRETFALNALVALDNAAWLLYAKEKGISNFDDLIPEKYKPALSHRHHKIASIPLMSYNIPIEEIKRAVEDGYFFMKIKIGSPGDAQQMLEWDKARIEAIHKAIGGAETPYTKNGKLPYYFDANGRYPDKETLRRFLDHCKKIGAFEQIAIVEEPFPEEYEENVDDLGVRIAADESAHTDKDALKRIQMGYGAIALKAIAKTLSMTLKIAKTAHENDVPCFCADLTVNPILVEWNKNVAARLAPIPGLETGLLETNGHQNYRNWKTMRSYHPFPQAKWTKTRKGVFELDADYYEKSGGIFRASTHYEKMFE
ncbi:MAG: L-alanine-DL-glutamate epimerase [Actinobacteria bacterium]|nr:L-alanine-DL-glutamate epimerase [Actinomycetota bacterium]